MKLSQMAAEAAANYEYDIIMAKVNGKLTEISDREIQDALKHTTCAKATTAAPWSII